MKNTEADTAAAAQAGRAVDAGAPATEAMTHRQRIEALVGLLLGMFVALLSSTIVSNALPVIIPALHGTQDQYTWVVVATLLASTATTPIWGKFSDLTSKKLLVQVALAVFTLGSVLAGLSHSVPMLIGARAVQGLGLGGLQALVLIVIAAMFSPRERGRYQGPIAAVMAVATIAGPLIGGVIVDTSWLGWRWTFFVCVPLAVVAMFVIQRTLNLPVVRRKVSIDYLGATLIAAGVSVLLIWVTLAGKSFEWASALSFALVIGSLLVLALAVLVESKAAEPIIPLHLFRDRTTTLATIASISVGVALFGSAVFLGQYFQIARGYSPTISGLLTLPMVLGSMLSSAITGSLITKFGRWKGFLVSGAAMMTVGFVLLSTIDHATHMVLIGGYLLVLGLGMGAVMQNLVLAVQNTVAAKDLGSATSTVSFFRSLGGAAGVSVLGAVLSNHVAELIVNGLSALGIDTGAMGAAGLSNLNEMPGPIQTVIRASYGDATARIFLVSAAMALLALAAIVFIREVRLREESGLEQLASTAAEEVGVAEAIAGQVLTTESLEDETRAAERGESGRSSRELPGDDLPDPLVTQRT